jgi:hypothetical protein
MKTFIILFGLAMLVAWVFIKGAGDASALRPIRIKKSDDD